MIMEKILRKNPIKLVDVGASSGIDSRWHKIKHLRPILFEPDPREFDRLKKQLPDHYVVLNVALADKAQEIDFFLCKKQQVSSCFQPNRDFIDRFADPQRFDIKKCIKIQADTLDNQLRKNGISKIDFLKLDAQGFEYHILRGATDALDSVLGLEVEVEFVELYEKQPLFVDVHQCLSEKGFAIYDLRRYFWKRRVLECFHAALKGQLVFGEALYFRTPENLINSECNLEKVVRAVCLYNVYGYFDAALSLIDLAMEKSVISREEYNELYSEIKSGIGRRYIPEFRGKGRIYSLLIKLANQFSLKSWGYGTDDKLGNR